MQHWHDPNLSEHTLQYVTRLLPLLIFRETARAKGLDEFLKHIGRHSTSPGITRQADLILQHWQDLDLKAGSDEARINDADSQADDDPEDLHAGETMGAAESIHSHGKHQRKQSPHALTDHDECWTMNSMADVSKHAVLIWRDCAE